MSYQTSMILLFAFAVMSPFCPSVAWDYKDPSSWVDIAPTCGGSSQSPIDIHPKNVVFDETLKTTLSCNYFQDTADGTAINTGKTIQVDVENPTEAPYECSGIPGRTSSDLFRLAQFHLHWGLDSTHGSEHTIEGAATALELHLVHWNTKYANISEAMVASDGLAVIGVLYEESEAGTANPEIGRVADIAKLHLSDESEDGELISSVKFSQILPPSPDHFYTYSGSLTTPDCHETVAWLVLHSHGVVDGSQMAKLRSLNSTGTASITPNYRPTLALNNRVVKSSALIQDHESNADIGTFAAITFLPTAFMLFIL